MTILEKTFRFEAAHRLVKGYCGKCASNHGHSWNGRVIVGYLTDELNQYGMLGDYPVLTEVITPMVEQLDHSTLVWEGDNTFVDFLQGQGNKITKFSDNPTSEVVAQHLFKVWRADFAAKGLILHEGVLEETCTTRCRVTEKNQVCN